MCQEQSMPLIQITNLEKTYCADDAKTQVLFGISCNIKDGEFVAIMGPSGSGKSTLLHNLLNPEENLMVLTI